MTFQNKLGAFKVINTTLKCAYSQKRFLSSFVMFKFCIFKMAIKIIVFTFEWELKVYYNTFNIIV